MQFSLTALELSWRGRAESLARELGADVSPAAVVAAAARAGLLAPEDGLLAAAVAVEAIACESPAAAVAYALHLAVAGAAAECADVAVDLREGRRCGAVALAADAVPTLREGRLEGRASWVAPITSDGAAIVGAHLADGQPGSPSRMALCVVRLDAPGIAVAEVSTAALRGVVCGHLSFAGVPCTRAGDPTPVMATVRVLLAAAGLGMGRRAVRESMRMARASNRPGAGGEQTVQGLVADAATEIDAAKLLTWKAASSARPSLADASMAKLAATEATQRAVARATQVVGADSFRRDHIVERLAQDVRALELFAGRTEALRDAVAADTLAAEGSGV